MDDEECIGMECEHYQKVTGTDPQTGNPVDEYMCSDILTNILLIENTSKQIRTGSAIESFRNEMVKDNQALAKTFANLTSRPFQNVIEYKDES